MLLSAKAWPARENLCLRQRFLVGRHWIYSQMEDPRSRKKMLAGRQRIYGPDTGFWLPETEDVEDSKPRPMILAARQRIGSPDRGFWLLSRGPGEKSSRTGGK